MSNIVISIISSLSIMCLFFVAIFIILKKVTKVGKTILWFFIPVYVVSFLLNFCSIFDKSMNTPFLLQVFYTGTIALKMFKFEISTSVIEELVKQNILYKIAIYFCYFMASLNTVYIIILLFINGFNDLLKSFLIRKKEHNIILLDNAEQFHLIKKLKKPSIIIVNEKQQLSDLQKIYSGTRSCVIYEINYKKALIRAGIKNKKTTFISLSMNEQINKSYIKILNEILPTYNKAIINYESMDVSKYVKSEKNIVFYNINNIISRNFIERYPLYLELDSSMINYKNAYLIDTNIKHFFVGCTSISNSIIDEIISNYQMIQDEIKIYIIDKNAKEIISKHDGTYYSNQIIKNMIKKGYDKNEYFELWNIMFDMIPYTYDRGSYKVKETILNNLGNYSLIYVDYGSDLINYEEALNLAIYLKHNLIENIKIYVKINNIKNINIEKLNDFNISIYGENIEELQVKFIENETLDYMAIRVNYYYAKKNYKLTDLDTDLSLWNDCTLLSKNSNRNVATNIIAKLNLLGLTLSSNPNDEGITKEEFLNIYNPSLENGVNIDLSTYQYDNPRINLAILEHYRWNTFQLFTNIFEMKKQEIFKNNIYVRKDEKKNLHSNILSLKGLLDLEQAISNNEYLEQEVKEKESQIFIKDFETMDNIYEIIEGTTYKIVNKNKRKI